MARLFVLAGTIAGFLAVALGAFGAHGLRGRLDEALLNAFNTGAQYQMYHALALLAVGILIYLFPAQPALKWSGICFLAGVVLFSGSLYALALTQAAWLGPITPVGGVFFMAGWLLLAYGSIKIL